MNWKELKIDKLPEDILTGDYEIQYKNGGHSWEKANAQPYEIVSFMCRFHIEYRYRIPKPLPPTHEARISLFWKTDSGAWLKPVGYQGGYYLLANSTFSTSVTNQPASWFTGRESAICPPEGV